MRIFQALLLVLLAVLVIFPAIANDSLVSTVTEVLIMALAATALNMLVGYCGKLSFGHAGLYAVGAYTVALLLTKTSTPYWVTMIAAPFVAAFVALIMGWFCVRLVEVYFALLALAFSQVIFYILFEWYGLTRGDQGIAGLPVPESLISCTNNYYFTLCIVIPCLAVMWAIGRSPFGMACQSTRENPERAGFIGINVRKYQLIAFILSGFFIGISGALYATHARAVFPAYAGFMKSGEFVLVCILGGMFQFIGPSVGALIYIILDHVITSFTVYWPTVIGLILILVCLFFSGGVTGFIAERYRNLVFKTTGLRS